MSIWALLFKYSIFWLPVVTTVVYLGLYVYAKKAKKFFLGFDFTTFESLLFLFLMMIPILNTALFIGIYIPMGIAWFFCTGLEIIGPAIKRSLRF